MYLFEYFFKFIICIKLTVTNTYKYLKKVLIIEELFFCVVLVHYIMF